MILAKALASSEHLAVPVLAIVPGILSAKYYTSAAFERPIHFTILTFAISGLVLRFATQREYDRIPQSPTSPVPGASIRDEDSLLSSRGSPHGAGKLATWISQAREAIIGDQWFFILLGCLVARTLFFWCAIRTSQCAMLETAAFLPLLVFASDFIFNPPISPTSTWIHATQDTVRLSAPPTYVMRYSALALAWAILANWGLSTQRVSTGTACTSGWSVSIPSIQLCTALLDGVLLVGLERVSRGAKDQGQQILGISYRLCVAAGLLIGVLSILTLPFNIDVRWSTNLRWVDLLGLMMDSIQASAVLICALLLLPNVHATSLAGVISGSVFFGGMTASVAAGLSLNLGAVILVLTAAACVCVVHQLSLEVPGAAKPRIARQTQRLFRICVVAFSVLFGIRCLFMAVPKEVPRMDQVIQQLIETANTEAGDWAGQAASSKTLGEATAEYRRRYGIPPPPNFDKWYQFAVERNSTIIDDFDQIYHDLLPYWAVEPADIRARTQHLLEHARVEMGGLRVSNGALSQAANIPGTHRWMTNAVEDMIRPFAEWLPDMDLAFNLADESRISIAYEEMEELKTKAEEERSRVAEHSGSEINEFSKQGKDGPMWPPEMTQPETFTNKVFMSSNFTTDMRRQIYYDRIAPTCPPGSKARTTRWWDWSTACLHCAAPHSTLTTSGNVISDVPLARDLCHQPDVSGLNGFILSSCNSITTQDLFPVFSQGRASGFSDILYPSPWNYAGKTEYLKEEDPTWEKKKNGMFWRGASTDGFAAGGKWLGFLRTRFAYEAYQQVKKRVSARRWGSTPPLSSIDVINVTFSGEAILFCHWPDCGLQQSALESWVSDEALNHEPVPGEGTDGMVDESDVQKRDLPDVTPFTAHWKYRHLMDMDGAGFSGRFITFLESRSLIYRANAFRAWFDERLQPWHHYVPVDVRLGEGFWSMVNYFASSSRSGGGGGPGGGEEQGKAIADQGRVWARKVLRTEDMEIYMFRLLLEWGRLVDDARNDLGFQMSA